MVQYRNPFPGKPTRFELSGLFLPSPNLFLKIGGLSLSGIFADDGKASTYKQIDQVAKGVRSPSQGLISKLINETPQESRLHTLLEKAWKGDPDARSKVESLGVWETFLEGMQFNLWDKLPYRYTIFLAIEIASKEPMRLICRGEFLEAAELLKADRLMSNFLWPDALAWLPTCRSAAQFQSLRASVALEVLLSFLAGWDAELCSTQLKTPESQLLEVLPNTNRPEHTPTKLFFEWFKKEIGAKSIMAILDHAKFPQDLQPENVTLKRWSSGRHFPQAALMNDLITAFWDEDKRSAAWMRYWGARHMNFIGYLNQSVSELITSSGGENLREHFFPWPQYPFGYDTFESWCQGRYRYWFEYHMAELEEREDF